tara:strand:+ start:419 stop:565 length:147 start_codon:yes stop_codon:yes gene_type:complete
MAKKKTLAEKIQKELDKLEVLREKETDIISSIENLVMDEEDDFDDEEE